MKQMLNQKLKKNKQPKLMETAQQTQIIHLRHATRAPHLLLQTSPLEQTQNNSTHLLSKIKIAQYVQENQKDKENHGETKSPATQCPKL